MRVGIDARFVGPEGTGLGKYTEKLIKNLANLDSKNEYSIFLRRANWDWLPLKSKNFTKVLADVKWYSVEEQIKLPKIFASANLDLLHIPHFNAPVFYKGKFVVTIHDLIHNHFKETSTTTKNPLTFKIKRLGYGFVISNAVNRSKKIIVPSNFVKDDIISHFKINPEKIAVTYEAAEEEYFQNSKFKTQNSKFLEKYAIRKPFLIYVGNVYPHKNVGKLLDAVEVCNVNLVIVCPRDVFWRRLKEEISSRDLDSKVSTTGYLGADELKVLFGEALAYVFPSLSEGFGIPGLNAMAVGLPVLASDIGVLKEIYGNAALYFDPNNSKDISNKINKVLSDEKTRSDLVERGREQVKKYSWEKMAKETLEVYQETD